MLPALRQDLSLHAGPAAEDGAPTWVLHDPATNRFFRLSWPAFEILSRWQLKDPARVLAAIHQETTLRIDTEDLTGVLTFLTQHHLLEARAPMDTARLAGAARELQASWWKWLLHNYLFLRIPLLRPARLLEQLAPRIGWAFTPRFWMMMVLTALVGGYLVSRQWDTFLHSMGHYTSLSGMLAIAISLSLAKVVHELGHACTAHRYGCRVPTMGVALLLLWPVLYTDTNDAWKLPDKGERLRIAAAGMLAELALAACATLAWNFMPDGALRGGMFLLATTTWIFTLAINASPFMRYDGYFLLCDWLEMPNLHARAFAFGRWRLRKLLFGWNDPPPESFAPLRRRFLILFAYATWLYRLILFLGIAWVVYHAVFKLLGLLLLAVEIGWFIALPLGKEMAVWWQRRSELTWNLAAIRSAVAVTLMLGVSFVPLSRDVRAAAVIGAAQSQGLYAVSAARVTAAAVPRGTLVRAGQVLVSLESPDLTYQLDVARTRLEKLRWQLDRRSLDSERLQDGIALHERLAEAEAEVAGLAARAEQLIARAPFDGRVVYVNEGLVPGAWVAAQEKLLHVTSLRGTKGEVFLSETDLARLPGEGRAVFVPELAESPARECRWGEVDKINLTVLDSPYVASRYGGAVPAQANATGSLVPSEVMFRARLERCDLADAPSMELRGEALLRGEARSFAGAALRRAVVEVQRELGR